MTLDAMIEPWSEEQRTFRFVLEQYRLFSSRVTTLQAEREQWIRHSILATFAYFGWITVYSSQVAMTFMLGTTELDAIYMLPVVFNLGGALRFFFIQRDINRTVLFLMQMEREMLGLPEEICKAADGQGLRDRHWHVPSIAYWITIIGLSGGVAVYLTLPH
ncbi:hypothetical protein AAD018_015920 [Aestuariibius insulae]|uniref:hypothetical protein n=1 Tax=Aestuariibius insulae TaxID=2058287 RepID=UPI00345E31FC